MDQSEKKENRIVIDGYTFTKPSCLRLNFIQEQIASIKSKSNVKKDSLKIPNHLKDTINKMGLSDTEQAYADVVQLKSELMQYVEAQKLSKTAKAKRFITYLNLLSDTIGLSIEAKKEAQNKTTLLKDVLEDRSSPTAFPEKSSPLLESNLSAQEAVMSSVGANPSFADRESVSEPARHRADSTDSDKELAPLVADIKAYSDSMLKDDQPRSEKSNRKRVYWADLREKDLVKHSSFDSDRSDVVVNLDALLADLEDQQPPRSFDSTIEDGEESRTGWYVSGERAKESVGNLEQLAEKAEKAFNQILSRASYKEKSSDTGEYLLYSPSSQRYFTQAIRLNQEGELDDGYHLTEGQLTYWDRLVKNARTLPVESFVELEEHCQDVDTYARELEAQFRSEVSSELSDTISPSQESMEAILQNIAEIEDAHKRKLFQNQAKKIQALQSKAKAMRIKYNQLMIQPLIAQLTRELKELKQIAKEQGTQADARYESMKKTIELTAKLIQDLKDIASGKKDHDAQLKEEREKIHSVLSDSEIFNAKTSFDERAVSSGSVGHDPLQYPQKAVAYLFEDEQEDRGEDFGLEVSVQRALDYYRQETRLILDAQNSFEETFVIHKENIEASLNASIKEMDASCQTIINRWQSYDLASNLPALNEYNAHVVSITDRTFDVTSKDEQVKTNALRNYTDYVIVALRNIASNAEYAALLKSEEIRIFLQQADPLHKEFKIERLMQLLTGDVDNTHVKAIRNALEQEFNMLQLSCSPFLEVIHIPSNKKSQNPANKANAAIVQQQALYARKLIKERSGRNNTNTFGAYKASNLPQHMALALADLDRDINIMLKNHEQGSWNRDFSLEDQSVAARYDQSLLDNLDSMLRHRRSLLENAGVSDDNQPDFICRAGFLVTCDLNGKAIKMTETALRALKNAVSDLEDPKKHTLSPFKPTIFKPTIIQAVFRGLFRAWRTVCDLIESLKIVWSPYKTQALQHASMMNVPREEKSVEHQNHRSEREVVDAQALNKEKWDKANRLGRVLGHVKTYRLSQTEQKTSVNPQIPGKHAASLVQAMIHHQNMKKDRNDSNKTHMV